MTMLSPAATYHAELRQQLDSVGRAISLQRGLTWMARGLAAGLVIVLGLVVWAWTRDGVGHLPIPLLVAIPVLGALLLAVGSMFVRHNRVDLARRVDRAAGLHERSMTALELGRQGNEFPLAVAQMRDAVEHLRRVELFDAFPLRLPRKELLAAFFVTVIAGIVAVSPNPWLLQARASNPSIAVAREQAQRVQRVAESLPQNQSPAIDALRQQVSQGAQTMQARSNDPAATLAALQDLENQVQQMSAADNQLAAALAAMSSSLAGNQSTQALSDAINTGDMRQISQATSDLAQAIANLSPQQKQQLAQVLQDAASKAGPESQGVANDMSAAANALQASAAAAGDPTQSGQQAGQASGQQGDVSGAQAQAASDALNQLSQSAAAADANQSAASQLQSSQNALERALGMAQSRAGNTSGNSGTSSSSTSAGSAANGQGTSSDQSGSQAQNGSGQGQSGDQSGGSGDQSGSGSPGDQGGTGDNTGTGGGTSTSGDGQSQNNGGSQSQLDAVTNPQQDQSGNPAPDESSTNPYTSASGSGNSQTQPQSVQPNYSSQPTQGNDSNSVPLGLRDLVKNYFSSLDQK
ncbi:MAG TPA: hypothetical protein VGK33_10760 [Chloroflexota bacterium]